jgi:L-threonylcarbamoyladenylate synthase
MGEIISVKEKYDYELISKIADYIKNDKVIIMPSDTIYGFLALPSCKEKIRNIKKRDKKPFLYLISSIKFLEKEDVDYKKYEKCLVKYWPGPITFILEDSHKKTIGFRMPDNDVLKSILDLIGKPVISTSVNLSGKPPLNEPDEIIRTFCNRTDLIIYDRSFMHSPASTVVDLTIKPYKVLRKGSIRFNEV